MKALRTQDTYVDKKNEKYIKICFLPWNGLLVKKNYQMFLAVTEAWLESHIWHDHNKDMKKEKSKAAFLRPVKLCV